MKSITPRRRRSLAAALRAPRLTLVALLVFTSPPVAWVRSGTSFASARDRGGRFVAPADPRAQQRSDGLTPADGLAEARRAQGLPASPTAYLGSTTVGSTTICGR